MTSSHLSRLNELELSRVFMDLGEAKDDFSSSIAPITKKNKNSKRT